ncbi:MAG: T9SS type A sorting domain-containing protein, partial [Pseudarcicella sp.]|nr:T9SS type A sorting domain-containing protein [Pseudarcicella sp.]
LNGYDYDQYYYNGWYGNEYYPNRGITIGCPLEIISPKTAKYQIEQITANEKEEKLSAKVFPNPTTDKINIETDGSPFSVQIFDITGILRQSHANSSNNNQLDISQLPKGTYILNIYSKKKKASFRIIKH